MTDYRSLSVLDPMDFELEPGRRVRDLASAAECTSAVLRLDAEMASIQSQISRSEADPTLKPAGWRSRAQNAMRWKKKVRRAVVAHSSTFAASRNADDKRQAILDVIQSEIGDERFEQLVQLAKDRHPRLPWSRP